MESSNYYCNMPLKLVFSVLSFMSGASLKERLSANPVLMALRLAPAMWTQLVVERVEQVLRICEMVSLQEFNMVTWSVCRASWC